MIRVNNTAYRMKKMALYTSVSFFWQDLLNICKKKKSILSKKKNRISTKSKRKMHNDRNGYGVLYYENSTHMKYKGNLINNKPHGHGTLYYNNAENTIKYEGGFKDGKITTLALPITKIKQ